MSNTDIDALEGAIADFWSFWLGHKDGYGTAINDRSESVAGEMAEDVGKRISAIPPDLQWETGPGASSEHHLAITAAGNHGLRLVAERVLAAAPEPCELWSYHSSRQRSPRSPGWSIKFDDGFEAKLDEFRFHTEIDENWREVDIIAYHPVFQEVDANRAHTLVFLYLDSLLGEDDVTSWLGSIDVTNEESDEAIDGDALRDMVDTVKKETREAGDDCFSLIEIQPNENEPTFIALWNPGLKRLDHVWLDHHVEIHMPLLNPQPTGLPDGEENQRLGDIEDSLVNGLGPDTVFFGHVTGRGVRAIRLHTTQESSLFRRIDDWIAENPEYQIEAAVTMDPDWGAHRDLLGLLYVPEDAQE